MKTERIMNGVEKICDLANTLLGQERRQEKKKTMKNGSKYKIAFSLDKSCLLKFFRFSLLPSLAPTESANGFSKKE